MPHPSQGSPSRFEKPAFILVLVLISVAVLRITLTYSVFSQAWDEPAHIAAGMEWLDQGRYRYEPQHPPLARVAAAIGPYLDGLHSMGNRNMWAEGNEILHARNTYERNLTLARAGVLPFFIVAALLVWTWTRTVYGVPHAVLAVALFTSLPPVLAHAGFATTDMALTATLSASILALTLWLQQPTLWRSALLGMCAALALLSKLSALLFLSAIGLALLITYWFMYRDTAPRTLASLKRYLPYLAISMAVCFAVIWTMYRFSTAHFVESGFAHPRIDVIVGNGGWLHDLAYVTAETVIIPAPEFFQGIRHVLEHNKDGHLSFLLGDIRSQGWWYYFPVTLFFKTPLPFLVFTLAGVIALVRMNPVRQPSYFAPLIAAAALLLAVLPSNINIGVRHILPIYPLLAIVAGVGTVYLWQARKFGQLGKITVVALFVWQFAASARVHPDYLAYFNELGGAHPERIVVAGDLDWGQDLKRLSEALRNLDIDEIWIRYYGSADVARHVPARIKMLQPGAPVTGWIAISMFSRKTGGGIPPYQGFDWLASHEPKLLVGKSILLYYIPPVLPQ